jgi:probable HAF family extracellular repeat protein
MNSVLWKDGKVINLGTLGGYESVSTKVNERGQVLGNSTNSVPDPYSFVYNFFAQISNGTQNRAFLWDQKNGMQDLGTLGGPDTVASDMNERGQIVGISYTSFTPNPDTGIPSMHPFLWDHGRMIDLGTFGGTLTTPPGGKINERGQVIGSTNLSGDTETHPFFWDKGKLTDIGTLGGTLGFANALNDAGDVAGQATTADGPFMRSSGAAA